MIVTTITCDRCRRNGDTGIADALPRGIVEGGGDVPCDIQARNLGWLVVQGAIAACVNVTAVAADEYRTVPEDYAHMCPACQADILDDEPLEI